MARGADPHLRYGRHPARYWERPQDEDRDALPTPTDGRTPRRRNGGGVARPALKPPRPLRWEPYTGDPRHEADHPEPLRGPHGTNAASALDTPVGRPVRGGRPKGDKCISHSKRAVAAGAGLIDRRGGGRPLPYPHAEPPAQLAGGTLPEREREGERVSYCSARVSGRFAGESPV